MIDRGVCKDCQYFQQHIIDPGEWGFCNVIHHDNKPVFVMRPRDLSLVYISVKIDHDCGAWTKRVVRYRLKEPLRTLEGLPDCPTLLVQGAGKAFEMTKEAFFSIATPIPPEEAL